VEERTSRSSKRRLWVLLGALVAAAVVGVAVRAGWKAYRFERVLAFQRSPAGSGTPAEQGLPDAVTVEYGRSVGAPLRGWYAPSTNGAAIVFVHGAGGDRNGLAREAALLHRAGFGVLLIDLPGRGESGGRITCGRTEEAAVESAVDWLSRQGVARIGGLGISLGSQFLARVAGSDPRIRAVVLEAASTSIIDRIRATQGRMAWLTTLPAAMAFFQEGTNPWREQARESMGAIAPRPLLLISGLHDPMATPPMVREMAARAGPSARLEMFDTGHGGYWEADPKRYSDLLTGFFVPALMN
jgi:pimeloyl-ACP methyl ester carboxylesterase